MGTVTEPTTLFGVFDDGYRATDDYGHAGYGETPEAANEALQHAQEVDAAKSWYTAAFGWEDTPK
jgi:hypothetical protein